MRARIFSLKAWSLGMPCFHHAVAGNDDTFTIALRHLRDLTEGGDYAYYVDLAHFMAGLTVSDGVSARA